MRIPLGELKQKLQQLEQSMLLNDQTAVVIRPLANSEEPGIRVVVNSFGPRFIVIGT